MATKKTTKEVSTETVSVKNSVIIGPRVTEKAAYATERNVFVFNIASTANKIQVRQAVKEMYKVTPLKVTVVVSKPKAKTFRGVPGYRSGFKKAYVTLKKGDTIDLN